MIDGGRVIALGCTQAGVAIARTMAKYDIKVIGVTYNPEQFGLASRYLREWYRCPHPRDTEDFINFLLDKAPEWHGALLLETNDYYLTAMSKNKDRLREHYRLVSPDWEVAQTFLEKDRAYALADSIGVPHPRIFHPETMEDMQGIADQMKFPVMIKPVKSHEFQLAFKEKLFICDTYDELRANFQRTLDVNLPVMICEIIPGTDYETLERLQVYINSKGQISTAVSSVKVRQRPPMFGVQRVGKTTPPNAEVSELALRLLKAVNFQGYASVEFKRDPRDNTPKLMEANVRQPMSTPLAIAAGVDVPWIIYQDLVLDHQEIVTDYQPNMYVIEAFTDLVEYIRRDPDRNLGRFLKPYFARNKSFSYFTWNDPGPFLRQVRVVLGRGIRKLLRLPDRRDSGE